MIKRFWVNNQQFVLLSGGGLVVFLILNYSISRLGSGAETTYRYCRKLQKEISLLHRDLKQSYSAEVKKVEAYEDHEEHLRSQVCLPADPEIKPSKTLMLEFSKEIESVWAAAGRDANRRGLQLPEKLTADDFGIEPTDGPREYQTYYSYLDIAGKALKNLVDSGVTYIGPVELIPPERPESVRVRGSEDDFCLYRGVGFDVRAPYASFIQVLEKCQEPGSFLQVRIRNLRPARSGAGEPEELRANLEFYGIRLEPIEGEPLLPASEEEGSDGGVFPARRRR